MVSLTKSQKEKLKREKKQKYAYDQKEIRSLLKEAYQEKKKVKIRYYSLSSDEVRWRKVAIYQFDPDFIIAHCYLRKEERVFKTERISQATILDEKYKVPKGWTPESRVWTN